MELEEVPKIVDIASSADSDKKSDSNEVVAAAEGTSGTESDKTGKEDTQPECPKSVSPEPNCSICLGKLENKSFTDSCFHTFCFVCLLEWSKVKAVCPLCKQAFKSIIHNVRSFEDYDQYHLRTEEQAAEELETRRFRFHSTMTNDRWWNHLRMEQQRQLALLRRPSRDSLATQWRRQRQAATSAYRRRIYASGMRVQEVRTATGRTMRYREISPEFYRRNAACMHRLVPWLNRELNVLLNNHEDHVQFVLELIMDLIKRFDIRSEEFFQHIQPFTGRRTEHFVHEFYSFARSPYDMFAYDQRAVYNEPEEQPVHTLDSSDNDSSVHSTTVIDPDEDPDEDPDCILVSSPEPNGLPADEMTTSQDHSYTSAGTIDNVASSNMGSMPELSNLDLTSLINQVQSFVSGVDSRTPGESTWDSPTPGPSNAGLLNDLLQGTSSDTPIDVTETTPVVKVKEESDEGENSDSSDVVVVGYEKPWEERSPLQISSDEEEERCATVEQEQKEKKVQKDEKTKAKKHKKQKSRSCSRERRSRSRSHNHQRSRSRKLQHSHERSRSRSRHEQHRRRSCSREYHKRDARESTWDRLKDRHRHQRHSKDYSSLWHGRSSRSKSPRYRHSRDDITDERDRRRRREVRSPSLENLQYSSLGQYDFSDTRSERSSRQGSRRNSETHLKHRSKSPSERFSSGDRRRRHDDREPDGRRSCKRSRSKSVEVIFRRRDRSKERHKKSKKHKRDRHSPASSASLSMRDKHKSSKENSSTSLSPVRESRRQSHDLSSMGSSPESRTDNRHNRLLCKKHPTGHKSSKHHSNRSDMSQETNSNSQPEISKNMLSPSSENSEKVSDLGKECNRSRNVSIEEDLLSSDSDVQVTRHQLHVQNISSESDVSSADIQITSSCEAASNSAGREEGSTAEDANESVPLLECGVSEEMAVSGDSSDASSNQNVSHAGSSSVSDEASPQESSDLVKPSDSKSSRSADNEVYQPV